MKGLVAFFLLATVSEQHSGFKELRNSLLSLIIEESSGTADYEQLLNRRDLWIKASKIGMSSTFDLHVKEEEIGELVLTEGGDKTKILQMIERLEDIQEKSRIYGITGTEVLMSALLTGFGARFQLASSENKTKMIEKIIIKADPTKEEKEARNLEDILVDASMTPNFIAEMNDRQSARIDFLFEAVRIASDPKKSQEEKESAIVTQLARSPFYTKVLEVDFNAVDFAERLILQFVWIKLDVNKEKFAKMSREEKMGVVVEAIHANMKSI